MSPTEAPTGSPPRSSPGSGWDFTFADTADLDAVSASINDRTRLIFTETPANPTLKYTDIGGVSEIASSQGIPHAVDNTFLTPYYQRPLELGADLVVHSTTKYFDGHNATVGGAWSAGPRKCQRRSGSCRTPPA